MDYIDLHTHSTASDGTTPPAELVREAVGIGLKALALTDHDTTAGLDEAQAAARELGLECIRGCELSAATEDESVHIVGLFLPPNPARLVATMEELNDYRANRNHIIIDKLNQLGCDISYDEVKEVAGEGSVGRPHFARVLLAKGRVTSVQEAFDRYLGPNGKAYTPKRKLGVREAIALLREEGATVILAHPGMLALGKEEQKRRVAEYKDLGLDGLEVYYSEYTEAQTQFYRELARDLDLLESGGSDYHGTVKPAIELGKGKKSKPNLNIPYALLERMKADRLSKGLPV